MKYILKYIKPYRLSMAIGLTIKSVGTMMDLVLPWILAYLIDDVVPQRNLEKIVFWGVVMLIAAGVGFWGNVHANRMASAVARDATRCIRHDLFEKIISLSGNQIDSFTVPSLESRLTSDTYNLHQMIGSMQRLGIRAPLLLVGGFIVSALFQPILTLVIAAILPFITLIVFKVASKGIPAYTWVQHASDDMVRVVRENVQGVRVVKALSKGEYEKKRFAGINAALNKVETFAGTLMAITNPLMSLFLNIGLTAVILVGAYCVNSGYFECGKIIAFMSYFTIILNAMLSVSRLFVMYSKGVASAGRIAEVLDTPEELTTVPDREVSHDGQWKIAFEDVAFSYQKHQTDVSGISIHVKPGGTLGILGATGSGKSTLIRLLLRFYDPDSGVIRMDGRDIRTIPKEEIYRKIGSVMQNDVLFEDTIKENIRFGRDIPDEDITRATMIAQADSFIRNEEDGYEHWLTYKGTNLSGGQKQRLLIARALAGNPEILILDDSSSALDYKTDAELRKALREKTEGMTKVMVAQRVSSVRDCDEIIVLEQGRIVGRGTDKQLRTTCEIYREICESQMGGMTDV